MCEAVECQQVFVSFSAGRRVKLRHLIVIYIVKPSKKANSCLKCNVFCPFTVTTGVWMICKTCVHHRGCGIQNWPMAIDGHRPAHKHTYKSPGRTLPLPKIRP